MTERIDILGLFDDVNRLGAGMVAVSDNGVAWTHSTVFIAKKARRKRKERCIVMPGNWIAIWKNKPRQMVYNTKH